MLETALEEDRAPPPAVVPTQLKVVLLARHAGHDVADTTPGIEAAVQQAQIGLARLKSEKAERRIE